MRKITLLALAGAALVPALSAPTPAVAYCAGYSQELGCINQLPCAAYGAVYNRAPAGVKLPRVECVE